MRMTLTQPGNWVHRIPIKATFLTFFSWTYQSFAVVTLGAFLLVTDKLANRLPVELEDLLKFGNVN
jgi:hypothetical protein